MRSMPKMPVRVTPSRVNLNVRLDRVRVDRIKQREELARMRAFERWLRTWCDCI